MRRTSRAALGAEVLGLADDGESLGGAAAQDGIEDHDLILRSNLSRGRGTAG